jgi:carboxymethylenebutenolidase
MKKLTTLLFALLLGSFVTAQDYAVQQLEESPRHHEWVKIESNNRMLENFVVYPESEEESTVVIVIHENRGLNDWARSFADQLASRGFITIAPDLLTDEKGMKTSDYETSDAARSALYELDPEAITSDLMSVLDYAKNLDSGNGKVAVVGFCWGGSQSFRFATNAGEEIEAAFVFYGTGPREAEAYANIKVPVYGFYGGNDNRVNSTIGFSEEQMKANGLSYQYVVYDGAGHAFMRSGDDPKATGPNKTARDKAFDRLSNILGEL